MNTITSAVFSVCVVLLVASCKALGPAQSSYAPPTTGKQWRLAKEAIGASSKESYNAGATALRTLDAFGTMEVSKLFYHGNLLMVPAGTLVAEAGPAKNGMRKVHILDGPQSGRTLWLYPESAEKMGFMAPMASR